MPEVPSLRQPLQKSLAVANEEDWNCLGGCLSQLTKIFSLLSLPDRPE